jgi:hypothetical protein
VFLSSPVTGRDTLVFFGIPLLGLLAFGYFHLDEIFASKTKGKPRQDGKARKPRVSYIVEVEEEDDEAPHLPESRPVKPLGRRY